jgi:hypothetical protein
MSAPQDEALRPPAPFDAFVWTPELTDESRDRRKLVRLCNRTRSIASGVSTIMSRIEAQGMHDAAGEVAYLKPCHIGALERIAIVALGQLEELALEYGDEVNRERQIAAQRPAQTATRGA